MNEEHRIWTDNLQESPNYAVEQLTGIWRATVAPAPHLLVEGSLLIGDYVPCTKLSRNKERVTLSFIVAMARIGNLPVIKQSEANVVRISLRATDQTSIFRKCKGHNVKIYVGAFTLSL